MGKKMEEIVEDIRRYYISPDKYSGNEQEVRIEIDKLDKFLLGDSAEREEKIVFDRLCEKYKHSEILDNMIRISLDGKGGASTTKNYREIYFNEIIQNANDNLNGNEIDAEMDIMVEKIPWNQDAEGYRLSFGYPDKGFHVKDIIGFFATEIHNKKEELSSTGKHGVGIKSLFYFVEHLHIKSNVEIDIKINKQNEDGKEKIGKIEFSLSKPEEKWDQKTELTIEFPKKDSYDEKFNVKKLIAMIDAVLESNDDRLKDYFFSEDQKELVFDLRGLLFTDKNAGKESGIKKIILNQRYTLFCREEDCVKNSGYWACRAELALYRHIDNGKKFIECQKYFLLTIEEKGKQNFSIAFPDWLKISSGKPRYYETYYIPYSDEGAELNFNILVNSEYSDVSRTKLTELDDKLEDIHQKIKEKVVEGLKYMTSEYFLENADKSLKTDVSLLFYKMLTLDSEYSEFTKLCCEKRISNKYLLKYEGEEDGVGDTHKYLVYKREEKELYEKEAFEQKKSVDEICAFMKKQILKDDSIAFSEETQTQFLEITRGLYRRAFDKEDYTLRKVLNAAGDVRDLIYYRIRGELPDAKMHISLNEEIIDERSKKLYDETLKSTGKLESAKAAVEEFLLIIGRYKLNGYISINGNINGASFYSYIFADQERDEKEVSYGEELYPSFQSEREKRYRKDYEELKRYLQRCLVNQNPGDCTGKIFKRAAERQKNKWWKEREEREKEVTRQLCRYLERERNNECTGYTCFYTSNHENTSTIYYEPSEIRDNEPGICDKRLRNQFIELLLCNDCENELANHVKEIRGSWYLYFRDYTYVFNSESEDEREKGGYLWGNLKEWEKEFSCYYQMAVRLKLINLDFLTKTCASDWEEFKFYFKAFEKMRKKGWYKSKTCLKTDNNIKMKSDSLTEVFRFFYEGERYSSMKTLRTSTEYREKISEFCIQLEDKPSINLCKPDMFEFIRQITKKEVYVMQTNHVQNRKELLYAYGGNLYVRADRASNKIGTYTGPMVQGVDDMLIIVHNDKLESAEAIRKVLTYIEVEPDIVQKCRAFISAESIYPIQGQKYNEFKDYESDVNVFHRTTGYGEEAEDISCNQSALSCDSLKKIILARGNHDGKCACCKIRICNQDQAGHIDGGKSELIITNNQNDSTKLKYPQIYEVVCERCKDILSKSLWKASIEYEDGKNMAVYECVAENNHQKKNVVWKSVLYPGIEALIITYAV